MTTISVAINTFSKMTTTTTIATNPTFTPPASALQHSPWHSPVPYLFGGLAAMLGLIAFALLILACSYWKLSRRLNDEIDLEAGDEKLENPIKVLQVFEEKIVVIMAGDVNPTFLATPVTSKACSIGDENVKGEKEETESLEEESEKSKENRVSVETHENQENQEQN